VLGLGGLGHPGVQDAMKVGFKTARTLGAHDYEIYPLEKDAAAG
jgi:hypothetical protein